MSTCVDPGTRDRFCSLGAMGVTVNRLALGTVNFGGRVDGPDAMQLLDHALEHGLNLIDTANIYGWRVHKGHTEELLGDWLARSGRRDSVVLATKVGSPMSDDGGDQGLSAHNIISACEASLRRLRTDRIDLLQIHQMDRTVAWDEIWHAMEALIAQGKVREVGSSNASGWELTAGHAAGRRRGGVGFASEQCLYNPLVRYAELELLPAAAAQGISVWTWSPLHGGALSGVLHKIATGSAVKSAQGRAASALREHREAIKRFETLCADANRSPAQLALQWTLDRPGVTGVVIGPRTTAHIDAAISALHEPADTRLYELMDDIFPPVGRGGPAPDAWIE